MFDFNGWEAPITMQGWCKSDYINDRMDWLPLAPCSLSMGGPAHYNGVWNSVQLCIFPIVPCQHWEHGQEDRTTKSYDLGEVLNTPPPGEVQLLR